MVAPPSTTAGQKAFSTLELLVSLGIVAVLLAIAFLAAAPMREQMAKVKCLSTLRNIGAAMQASIGEHNGILPGPLTDGQRLGYRKGSASDKNHLPIVLGPYLGLPEPTAETRYAHELACPAWERKLGLGGDRLTTPCYILLKAQVGGVREEVFGRTTDPKQEPVRYLLIDTPALQPALLDADAWLVANYAGRVPGEPVHHRAFRNALFFDWRAEPIPSRP